MNHSILAGSLCTLALILLSIESMVYKSKPCKYFLTCYALGCSFWISLGLLNNDHKLVTIGFVQAMSAATLLLLNNKEQKK